MQKSAVTTGYGGSPGFSDVYQFDANHTLADITWTSSAGTGPSLMFVNNDQATYSTANSVLTSQA